MGRFLMENWFATDVTTGVAFVRAICFLERKKRIFKMLSKRAGWLTAIVIIPGSTLNDSAEDAT